jgi:hypothetical protein
LVPQHYSAQIIEAQIAWNYTTWLNILFLGLAALLVWRFLRTGGPEMLRMMNKPVRAQSPPAFVKNQSNHYSAIIPTTSSLNLDT